MSDCTSCGVAHKPIVHHLQRAVDIQRRPPHEWLALIDQLPRAAREPCRAWLADAIARRPGRRPVGGRLVWMVGE